MNTLETANLQPLSISQLNVEGTLYNINGPMLLNDQIKCNHIDGVLVRLFGSGGYADTTLLSIEEYLERQFGPFDKATSIFDTLRVQWEGDDKPTSWVGWRTFRHRDNLTIYLQGPTGSNYGIIHLTKTPVLHLTGNLAWENRNEETQA